MEITVQWVRTSWTKLSRGGAGAARRNACPVGFRLPDRFRGASQPQVHVVRMEEERGFEPFVASQDLGREVGVQLHEAEGRLRVHVSLQYKMPPRRRRPPAVRLSGGQWVRWQLNYRYGSTSSMQEWSYWLDTYNIAYGPVAADAFLGSPDILVDEQGSLR